MSIALLLLSNINAFKAKRKGLDFQLQYPPFQLQLNCLKKHYIYFKGELKKEYKKIRLSIEFFYFFCYLCATNNLFYNDMQKL